MGIIIGISFILILPLLVIEYVFIYSTCCMVRRRRKMDSRNFFMISISLTF